MIHNIKTMAPWWIEWRLISIEIDSNKSLPGIDIIWLPDSSVKESRERLRSTFRSCNIEIPPHRYIINLSPSDIKKSGAAFDVPIWVGLLLHILWDSICHKNILSDAIFLWELGLDWSVKWISGVLSIVISAKKEWYTHFFIPDENKNEIECISWITIYPLAHFNDIIQYVWWNIELWHSSSGDIDNYRTAENHIDLSDIQWHGLVKRAIAIWAVWLHNILMIGPPWTWKSMIAKAIPGILPPMWYDEIIEVSQIYSLSWSGWSPLVTQRPFRSIHHTASKISLIGWGQKMSPWEISHAHNGVLFLDELPEFPRDVLDVLRQPIEDKCVTISRAHGSVTFPADCMVVGAMNPCICGYYNDTEKICTCAPQSIKKYQSRVSWPLLDRFDIIIDIGRQNFWWIDYDESFSSQKIKENINIAWGIQKQRYKQSKIRSNAQLQVKDIKKYIKLDIGCEEILTIAQKKLSLSHRAIHRILKVSRTIADYEWSPEIKKEHLLEALQYRSKEI